MSIMPLQEQFIFIHDAILESITCGDTQIITTDLRKMIVQLGKADPSTGLTGFSNQFKVYLYTDQFLSGDKIRITCM